MEVRFILPERSQDDVSEGLRALTAALEAAGVAELAEGVLGGRHGYGAAFENDVFMMHVYCWCERQDCSWCARCECPPEAWRYYVDGIERTYEEWMDFYMRAVYGMSEAEYQALPNRQRYLLQPDDDRLSEMTNLRRSQRKEPFCRVCRGEFGNAPNFLHKPSGSRVNWYKYIGRSMEVKLTEPWANILSDCLASIADHLPPAPTEGPSLAG